MIMMYVTYIQTPKLCFFTTVGPGPLKYPKMTKILPPSKCRPTKAARHARGRGLGGRPQAPRATGSGVFDLLVPVASETPAWRQLT